MKTIITTLDEHLDKLPTLKSTGDVLALFGIRPEREGLFTAGDRALMKLANTYWNALRRLKTEPK